MTILNVETVELAEALFGGDLFHGLDPILTAHLQERLEANPGLRPALAVAALGRVVGWED